MDRKIVAVDPEGIGGEVRINHSVIANIIRLSVLEVDGVASVVGSFFGGVSELLFKKDTERGITVREDECGRYVIEVRVMLYFGIPLTEVAAKIQRNVANQVYYMTQKDVARVDVTIDGVKVRSLPKVSSVDGKGDESCG
ncbi:MAG: Asp23/Gls24 family envelope stress response protein [Puniceicoccales bacterium]|jgi:uncharacterized alkaline shock family protein YloU|nr:Asp23/Gls24 family envelope stress response protein [Puniceicoccales bacterium]